MGSEFPEPKGESLLISLKKSSFNALGAIMESRYKLDSFVNPLKDFSVENLSCHALKPNKP